MKNEQNDVTILRMFAVTTVLNTPAIMRWGVFSLMRYDDRIEIII